MATETSEHPRSDEREPTAVALAYADGMEFFYLPTSEGGGMEVHLASPEPRTRCGLAVRVGYRTHMAPDTAIPKCRACWGAEHHPEQDEPEEEEDGDGDE